MNTYNAFRPHFDTKTFVKPESLFFPIYSWTWNDYLTEDGIKEQIDEFVTRGIKNLYVIPISKSFRPHNMRVRLSPDYMTNDFLKLFHFAVDYGRKNDLSFWLYDEDAWPSASCGGKVVQSCPELIQKEISYKKVSLTSSVPYYGSDKNFLAAFLDGRRISLPFQTNTDCEITVYFINERHAFNNPYPDILDPRTADLFLTLTHEKYALEFGNEFADVFPCVFIDEPNLAPYPWTQSLDEEFTKKYGYDLKNFLPSIFDEECTDEAGIRARIDYRNCIADLLVKNFYMKISTWCRNHNVLLTGHADGDDSILSYRMNGNLPTVLRSLDIPGIDTILRQIFPSEKKELQIDFIDFIYKKNTAENKFFPRIAASAANQTGKRFAMSESFAVYGSGLTYDQMRYVIHFQAVRGINIFNYMTAPYSDSSDLLTALRPIFCAQIPGSDEKSLFDTYVARLSYLLSLGDSNIHTALYFPICDVFAGGEYARLAADSYEQSGDCLEKKNINFDIIDDRIILSAQPSSTVNAGLCAYERIIVPECCFMPSEVSKKLQEFEKNGVKIITPDTLSSITSLPSEKSPSFKSSGHIKSVRRTLQNGALYFLYNEGYSSETTDVTFEETLPMYELNLTNGEIYYAQNPTTIRLESGEGIAFLFTSNTLTVNPRATDVEALSHHIILREFDVEILHRTILDKEKLTVTMPEGTTKKISLPTDSSPFGSKFSGDLLYKTEFTAHRSENDFFIIDLYNVCDSCEIILNDQSIGIIFAPPYRLCAPASLLKDKNTLKIRVSNTLANLFASTDVYDGHSYRDIGTYHYAEREFEKENDSCGLKSAVSIYLKSSI